MSGIVFFFFFFCCPLPSFVSSNVSIFRTRIYYDVIPQMRYRENPSAINGDGWTTAACMRMNNIRNPPVEEKNKI
jgi:hypothetical protein